MTPEYADGVQGPDLFAITVEGIRQGVQSWLCFPAPEKLLNSDAKMITSLPSVHFMSIFIKPLYIKRGNTRVQMNEIIRSLLLYMPHSRVKFYHG